MPKIESNIIGLDNLVSATSRTQKLILSYNSSNFKQEGVHPIYSEALSTNKQTKKYRIDAHWSKESSQKKVSIYLGTQH